ncbi:MAG: hypothetical protein R3F43_31750 [bacterium]
MVEPLAALAAYFASSPSARPDAWQIARAGDAWIGLTSGWGSASHPERLHTGLTAVLPAAARGWPRP